MEIVFRLTETAAVKFGSVGIVLEPEPGKVSTLLDVVNVGDVVAEKCSVAFGTRDELVEILDRAEVSFGAIQPGERRSATVTFRDHFAEVYIIDVRLMSSPAVGRPEGADNSATEGGLGAASC